jgi:hypothetical protein
VDTASGVAQFLNSVVVEAATTADEVIPLKDGFDIPLSRLYFAAPGGAQFFWEQGERGGGVMRVWKESSGALYGRVAGLVYSKTSRQPDGSYSKVRFRADFVAAEGAFGCDLPGVDRVFKK